MNIDPTIVAKIARHIGRTFQDVCFYSDAKRVEELVFCDLIEKAKKTDWKEFQKVKNKVDAELYLYSIVPEVGGVFTVHERLRTKRKKSNQFKVIAVKDRSMEGFGFVCALEEVKNG